MKKIENIEDLPGWLQEYAIKDYMGKKWRKREDEEGFDREVRENMRYFLKSLNRQFWSQTRGYPQGILDRAPISQEPLVEPPALASEALPMLPREMPQRVAHWIGVRVEDLENFSRGKPGGPILLDVNASRFAPWFHGHTNNFGVTISERNFGSEEAAKAISSPFNAPDLGARTKGELWDAVDGSLKRLGLLEGVRATLLPVPPNLLESQDWALERYGYVGSHQQGITKAIMWPSFVDLLCQGWDPDVLAS